jgi:hypothetical protein
MMPRVKIGIGFLMVNLLASVAFAITTNERAGLSSDFYDIAVQFCLNTNGDGKVFWIGSGLMEEYCVYKGETQSAGFLNDKLDKKRISSAARSGAWIQATYQTVSEPENFMEIGALYTDSDLDGAGDDWEIAQFGDTITVGKMTDYDGDGFSDVAEFNAGTDPKDSLSKLEVEIESVDEDPDDVDITWYGQEGRVYLIKESTNLVEGSWQPVAEEIDGDNQIKTLRVDTTSNSTSCYKLELEYDPAQ